ncbi:MAG TPA: type I-U CRISPR-associated RAMP protein Csb1/Cas7u [Candidatus Saccharimonadales bacterium]|nr:type I-U CRISPR-associated RAMP protein Csb1/Cas7u [Candidatus Saccharimonadales bacterium]
MTTLNPKILHEAVTKSAAAFRAHIELQPAGGPGSKIFPPTYEGGKYATEGPRYADIGGGQKEISGYDRVLLDSVQSQANRNELALLAAWERGELKLPVITVDFAGNDLPKTLRITSLEAPHRIADALLRDSLHPTEKVAFRKSSVGKALDHMDARNATALFQHCPTALVFGLWDSTGPKGGLGAKFARAMVSEIVGHDVQVGVRTSSRIDSAEIYKEAGPIYQSDPSKTPFDWTHQKEEAALDAKKNPILYSRGKETKAAPGSPSKANHGNVTPTIAKGGVIISRAVQTVVLSLTSLRRLSFPLNNKRSTPANDDAARTALAALGLCAATLAREQNQDLRSRCQLFPTAQFVWELLDEPGTEPKKFTLTRAEALSLYQEALAVAKKAGLPFAEDELVLTPSPQLIEIVRRSQELAAKQVEDNETEGGGAK